jgi:hypothetical protein
VFRTGPTGCSRCPRARPTCLSHSTPSSPPRQTRSSAACRWPTPSSHLPPTRRSGACPRSRWAGRRATAFCVFSYQFPARLLACQHPKARGTFLQRPQHLATKLPVLLPGGRARAACSWRERGRATASTRTASRAPWTLWQPWVRFRWLAAGAGVCLACGAGAGTTTGTVQAPAQLTPRAPPAAEAAAALAWSRHVHAACLSSLVVWLSFCFFPALRRRHHSLGAALSVPQDPAAGPRRHRAVRQVCARRHPHRPPPPGAAQRRGAGVWGPCQGRPTRAQR